MVTAADDKEARHMMLGGAPGVIVMFIALVLMFCGVDSDIVISVGVGGFFAMLGGAIIFTHPAFLND